MANTKSAAKRARQTVGRTLQNARALTGVKTILKNTRLKLAAKEKDQAKAEFQKLSSALDKAVKTGRLHRNVASRHKSKISKSLAALG